MFVLSVSILGSRRFISSRSLLHLLLPNLRSISSLSLRIDKPINWKTTHSFVQIFPLLSLLEKCESLSQLKQIQAQMFLTGFIEDGFASSRLIAFCALSESRDLHHCSKILYSIPNSTSFSWNVAIRGHVETGNPKDALVLYTRMLRNGSPMPDNHTYPLLLKACASDLSMSSMGFSIFGHVLKLGFEADMFVHNALICALLSFGELKMARNVFDESCVRDVVTWNSMITGLVRRGMPNEALEIYEEMMLEGVRWDEVTMIGVVSSCAQLENLNLGREVHRYIEENGMNMTIRLANALMDMYVKCGDLTAARNLFDKLKEKTVVSWTTMIWGYAKFGFVKIAWKLLHEIPEQNVAPWNAILGGCVLAKNSKEALILFHEMQTCNVKPDEVTMVNCLSACSQLGALDVGFWVHCCIEKHALCLNVALGTALINMYAKCGHMTKAIQIFQKMPQRNSLTWTAMICGLALNRNAHDAICYFSEMIQTGLVPDETTFLGVLSACCHGGLVDEGREYFAQMSSKFNISPKLRHYSCMVDLLGRAALLEEAEKLIDDMPMEADAAVWGALFFACRIHGNVIMGKRVASKLLELDPGDSGIYTLLSNMYCEANMWEEARNVRELMKERGLDKTPGCSSIEVNGIVNEFIVRDKLHPQCEWIYECLVNLMRHLELAGCIFEDSVYEDL